ncbi:MAG: metal-dependent hydrolase [Desulforhopalus sp.]|nr:metal-dependent hydrolase [Desulforhopalus sp.]
MPNTLCHIALQAPPARQRPEYLPWILLGCILPDAPWIILHLLQPAALFEPFTLRFYATAQASLAYCLLISAALSLFTRRSGVVFALLGGNCLFHLLLDSLQDKWGNGVNLLAPFNWHLFSLNLISTDNYFTAVVTTCGLILLTSLWGKSCAALRQSPPLQLPRGKKALAALLFAALYLFTPPLFFGEMDRANTWNLHTMRLKTERPGKAIAYDRGRYNATTQTLRIFSGEELHLEGKLPAESGRVSIKGFFISPERVRVSALHLHNSHRDRASRLGILLACFFLCQSLFFPRLSRLWRHRI